MITCDDVKPYLWDYFDGECDAEIQTRLVAHLSNCASCQERLDEWVALSEKVYRNSTVKAPPFLWTRVLAQIEEKEASIPAPWWIQWRWMSRVTMAATIVVSLGAAYVFNSTTTPLELLLEGQPDHHAALHLASSQPDTVVANVVMGSEQ